MSDPTFFSFRKPSDWRRGTSYQLEWMEDGFTIGKEKVYRQISQYALSHSQMANELLDTVIDQAGRWYILDREGVIWRADIKTQHIEAAIRLEQLDDRVPERLAIAQDTLILLFANAATGTSTLTGMSLDRGQIRWTCNDWYGESFTVYSVIGDDRDGMVALGRIGQEELLQLLRFDASGTPTVRIPLTTGAGEGEDVADRFQLIQGREQDCWLLDRFGQRLLRIHLATNQVVPFSLSIDFQQEELLSFYDGGGRLYWGLVKSKRDDEGQSLIAMRSDGEIVRRGYTGNAGGDRLFAGDHALYVWNSTEKLAYAVKPVTEIAVWEPFGSRIGVWMSDGLDSGVYETQWHKIVVDAIQQHDTQLHIRYYASDHLEVFLDQEHVNLNDFIANDDIPPETKLAALTPLWSKPLQNPEDALLHQARGRYLWLFVEMIGSSEHAPVVRSMEVFFPRSSYLEYLPVIYQQDERSKDFLARYLSLFQTILEDTDSKIQQVTRSLEAGQASGPSLRWLLGWLGIQADDDWSDDKLRKLLQAAPMLYSLRGTKLAMQTLIDIYTGEKPIILEYEHVKPLKENPELGEVAERLYAADPHVFNVLVKAEHADTEMKRVTLQQLIEAYKPVFSTCKLIILQPWVYMDLHSYLGMNTVLSEPTLLTLDGRSSMPHHTITIDVGQENRMDQHTRLGLNSRLE